MGLLFTEQTCNLKKKEMKNQLLYILLSIVFLCSCSAEHKEEEWVGMKYFTLNFAQPDVLFDVDSEETEEISSRVTDSGSGVNFVFTFEHKDTMGIFSQGGYQIPFEVPLASGATATSVSISAQGWMTKLNDVYAIYMPFDFYNRKYDRIPWDGRKIIVQKQNGKKDYIGRYWFAASDTIVQSNTLGNFNKSVKMMGAEVRARCKAPVTGQYVKMMLVAPSPIFSTHGEYDIFDVANGQPYYSLGNTDHVTLINETLTTSQVNKQVQGFFYFPSTDARNMLMTLYVWTATGDCYMSQLQLTGNAGNFVRNSISDLNFTASMQLVTSPNVKLNPWEDEDLCPTCNPVAF